MIHRGCHAAKFQLTVHQLTVSIYLGLYVKTQMTLDQTFISGQEMPVLLI